MGIPRRIESMEKSVQSGLNLDALTRQAERVSPMSLANGSKILLEPIDRLQ